jgi:CRP-like cAMP-binding protein
MLESRGALVDTSSPLERMLELKKLPTYGTLPTEELAVLSELTRERYFPKGARLLAEGEPVPAVYVVLEGKVEARRQGRVVGTVSPGGGIGALGLLSGDPYALDAVALEDTLALEMETEAMFEVFEDRFAILHHILQDLCRQLISQQLELRMDPSVFVRPGRPFPVPGELDFVERIFLLRRMEVFRSASINALSELSRALTQVSVAPGTVLWRVGEAALSSFVVVSGRVRCRAANEVTFEVGPGFPLGTLDAIAQVPRWFDAVVEEPLVSLQGPAETLIDVFEDNFDLARLFLANLARALISVMEARAAAGKAIPSFDPPSGAPVVG